MLGTIAAMLAAAPFTALIAARGNEATFAAAVDEELADLAHAAGGYLDALSVAAEDRLVAMAEDPVVQVALARRSGNAAEARARLASNAGDWFSAVQLRGDDESCALAWPRSECSLPFPDPLVATDERGLARRGPGLRCARIPAASAAGEPGPVLGMRVLCGEIDLERLYEAVGAMHVLRGGRIDLLGVSGRELVAGAGSGSQVRLETAAARAATARSSARGLRLPGRRDDEEILAAWVFSPTAGVGALVQVERVEALAPARRVTRQVMLVSTTLALVLAGLVFRISRRVAGIENDAQGARLDAERRAMTDALTGLRNRAAFDNALLQAIDEAGPGRSPAVVLVDLDYFKAVNDSRGHEAGDHALRAIAHALRLAARQGDLVARIGGDEFAFLVQDGNASGLHDLAGRLEAVVDSLGIAADIRRGTLVGASVGWARWSPGEDASALLRRADASMYERKARRKKKSG
ncbi:MAG: diguanylate cyclase [Deltaproteobacteria bacterium]|nr:diguanylate cyclase [Deltaproteobacteria bacterium]